MPEKLPLFPLNTLLVPDMVLPLQIFEQRYLQLTKDCLKNNSSFGIVPIRDGREVGEVAMIYDVGVSATIVDWSQGDNGLLNIKVQGGKKFKVLSTSTTDDQLMLSEVEYLPDEPELPIPVEFDGLNEMYDSLSEHPQVQILNLPEAKTAKQLGCFLAMLLPINRAEQVDLLKMDRPIERLQLLADIIDKLGQQ
jgi:Lon protease-like protein